MYSLRLQEGSQKILCSPIQNKSIFAYRKLMSVRMVVDSLLSDMLVLYMWVFFHGKVFHYGSPNRQPKVIQSAHSFTASSVICDN